jgi:hypothetical protein
MNPSPVTNSALPIGLHGLMIVSSSFLTSVDGVTDPGAVGALRGWSIEAIPLRLTLVDHSDLAFPGCIIREGLSVVIVFVLATEDHPHSLKCLLVLLRVVGTVFVKTLLVIL